MLLKNNKDLKYIENEIWAPTISFSHILQAGKWKLYSIKGTLKLLLLNFCGIIYFLRIWASELIQLSKLLRSLFHVFVKLLNCPNIKEESKQLETVALNIKKKRSEETLETRLDHTYTMAVLLRPICFQLLKFVFSFLK